MGRITELVNERIALGMSASQAIRAVAQENGVSKNEVYRVYHQE